MNTPVEMGYTTEQVFDMLISGVVDAMISVPEGHMSWTDDGVKVTTKFTDFDEGVRALDRKGYAWRCQKMRWRIYDIEGD